jgi:hypothetical protein
MKVSAVIEGMSPSTLTIYANFCGWSLARAHARSGDPIAMAAYLGGKERFDKAITSFSESYADQNERDYAAFVEAIRDGRLAATKGI